MHTRQIVYFLALCEELHFTRAAKRCGVAQPSLTNAIRALEREFGVPLFERKPKPRLSEFGEAVRPDLERVLAHVARALARARRAPRQLKKRNRETHRTQGEEAAVAD
jgi:DNA-binding transcriptional LysR family regulator